MEGFIGGEGVRRRRRGRGSISYNSRNYLTFLCKRESYKACSSSSTSKVLSIHKWEGKW